MGLKETENNLGTHLGTLKPAEDDQSNKEQRLYSSKKQPLVGTQLMLPTENQEPPLQLPLPSTSLDTASTARRESTHSVQQERTAVERRKTKGFFSPKQQVWRT